MRKALKVFGIVMDRRRGGKGVPMMPVNAAAFHRGRSGRAVAVAATVSGHNAAMFDTPADLLPVAISSRPLFDLDESRSDERRVGKEGVRTCKSRWSPVH